MDFRVIEKFFSELTLITVSLHMQRKSRKFKYKLKKRLAASPRIRFKYAEVVSVNEVRLRLRVAVRGWSLHNDRISILVSRDTGENELQLILLESFSFFNFNLKNSKDATGENALGTVPLFLRIRTMQIYGKPRR